MAYQLTPKRLAAARANIRKAWQAHWLGRVPRPARPPNLRHGFFARDLRRSVILLGEDVREYDAHVQRFEQGLTPRTERERRIVRRLAETAWQLIRGYRARAHAQARKLRKEMDSVVDAAPLNDRETRALAYYLVETFNDERYLQDCVARMRNQFERLFRLLLIERTGSDMGLRVYSQAKFSKWDQEAPFA
jgi:hypothetical protein